MILGQHFLCEEHPGGVHAIKKTDRLEDIRQYVSCVVAAIRSGVFTYIAHPDMFNFIGDRSVYEEEMRKICIASRECQVPLEINFLGIRDHRIYPNEAFWKLAGEEMPPVTFGFDAHDVQNACDRESLVKARELVEKYDLNYIGKPGIVLIQEL